MCLIFTFQRYHESAPLPGWVVFLISWLGTTAFSRSGLSPHRHASQASNATALPKVCWLHPHFAVHASDLLLQSPAVFSGCWGDDEGSCLTAETWLPGMNLPPVLLLRAQSPEDICCYSS